MDEIYKNAKKLMQGFCRVCPVCNGRACAGEVPGMGGLGTASSFTANVRGLAEHQFNMRLIHGVKEPDTRVTLLGKTLTLPVLAAPIGGVSFNMGGGITEQEYVDAVIRGCVSRGTLGCTGDGVPDFIHQSGFQAIEDADGAGIPFIKPWEDDELFAKLAKAQACGAGIIGMDIDAAGLVTLRQMGRPVGPKNRDELKRIRDAVKVRFILKGIMTVEDAELAAEVGVDGIVVSNHGGRVLDYARAATDVLPAISAAVKGKTAILADGGVRSGGDVMKLLALGAEGVMIGRPFSVAAVGGLQEGVEKYLDKIHLELQQTMILTGTPSVSQVDPAILAKKSR